MPGTLAYLVGGSVRDLLLGRRPKDYDIGTSAHPYQVKRLFRNCWIIGRRFRLAHIRFGDKVIEVATFRRQVPLPDQADAMPDRDAAGAAADHVADARSTAAADEADLLIKRDNTFGTPEEDAFRRDFTVNALFYDIATFSIIDYVGGLADLRSRLVRSIGDPEVRFREDPVRMLRAVALACRLQFDVDAPSEEAILRRRGDIARSAPSRLLEEYYKILRAGWSESTFRRLVETGLLEPLSPGLHDAAGDPLWHSLAALDRYRRRFEATPPTLTNAILLGSLLVPLGWSDGDGGATGRRRVGARPAPGPAARARAAAANPVVPAPAPDASPARARRPQPDRPGVVPGGVDLVRDPRPRSRAAPRGGASGLRGPVTTRPTRTTPAGPPAGRRRRRRRSRRPPP